jgi:hypothetical protein
MLRRVPGRTNSTPIMINPDEQARQRQRPSMTADFLRKEAKRPEQESWRRCHHHRFENYLPLTPKTAGRS